MFWLVELDLQIIKELSGEGIAVVDSEDSFEEVYVDWDVQILPGVVIGKLSDDSWYFLSFEEDSLGNTWVLYFGFGDKESLVWEIVVDEDWPDSIVF